MPVEANMTDKGIIDAMDRFARELIRTPKFKEAIIILLRSVDPPSARNLIRTLFWEDPGLLLSFLGALPAITNALSESLAEVASQMGALPSTLLHELLGRVIVDLDGVAMGEAVGGLVSTVSSLEAEGGEGLRKGSISFAKEFKRGYQEAAGDSLLLPMLEQWMADAAARAGDENSATHDSIKRMEEILRRNPEFVRHILRPLFSAVLEDSQLEE